MKEKIIQTRMCALILGLSMFGAACFESYAQEPQPDAPEHFLKTRQKQLADYLKRLQEQAKVVPNVPVERGFSRDVERAAYLRSIRERLGNTNLERDLGLDDLGRWCSSITWVLEQGLREAGRYQGNLGLQREILFETLVEAGASLFVEELGAGPMTKKLIDRGVGVMLDFNEIMPPRHPGEVPLASGERTDATVVNFLFAYYRLVLAQGVSLDRGWYLDYYRQGRDWRWQDHFRSEREFHESQWKLVELADAQLEMVKRELVSVVDSGNYPDRYPYDRREGRDERDTVRARGNPRAFLSATRWMGQFAASDLATTLFAADFGEEIRDLVGLSRDLEQILRPSNPDRPVNLSLEVNPAYRRLNVIHSRLHGTYSRGCPRR